MPFHTAFDFLNVGQFRHIERTYDQFSAASGYPCHSSLAFQRAWYKVQLVK